MRFNKSKVRYREIKLRTPIMRLCFMGLLVLTPLRNGRAQEEKQIDDHGRTDISTLKRDVNTLSIEQRKIIDQLNDLRALLPSKLAARPVSQLPDKLNVHADLFKGNAAARVALIEYSDFECPFCGGYERETAPQIFDGYIKTGKVKLFYRDFPLPMHPHALQAARAAQCAGEQGKYWEMHDSLFAKQTALSDPTLLDRAETMGLDMQKFGECFSSDKYKDEIQKSIAEAQKLGIQATPTFFIGTIDPNGDVVNISKRIIGARPYEEFKATLDELLASHTDAASAHSAVTFLRHDSDNLTLRKNA